MGIINKYGLNKLALLVVMLISIVSYSQKYTEYDVKAAYLYNFSKFITWPDESKNKDKDFVFVVYKNEAFAKTLLNLVKDRQVKGRKCVVRLVYKPEDIPRCNILFVSNVSTIELKKVLTSIKSKQIVTVGDNIEDFCLKGGVINFTSKHSEKRFEINLDIAKKKEIRISSKLIVLAKIISSKYVVF